ncbi:MAG: sugar phosphate isomerase/epimerase [Tunicatimonas sp.]
MKRRTFLRTSAAASLSLPLVPLAFGKVSHPYVDQIGLQLYTVRNQMAENPLATLKAIQAAGYAQIEGGNPATEQSMIAMAKDVGLSSQSSFFPWPHLTGRWDLVEAEGMKPTAKDFAGVVESAQKLGMNYLVFGYMRKEERQTLDDYHRIAEKLNEAGEQCNAAGIKLCYHNHAFEFEPIDGTVPYDILIDETDADKLHFELDVFWSSLAGHEPLPLMKKLGNRITLLHLKNKKRGTPLIYDESTVPIDAFQELDDGVIDIKKILLLAEKNGVEQCFVEQDQSPDPIQSISQSAKYLHAIENKL